MSEPLFEQYKAALRRGHVAALAGRLEEALEAYQAAARLVPERALPFASQGTTLHRLDRWPEAADAFDTALRLSPDDEATLRARAGAREERGLRSGAAADMERLAFVLDVAGRSGEAVDAARRALELEGSPAREALVRRLGKRAPAVDLAPAVEPEIAATAPQPPGADLEPDADSHATVLDENEVAGVGSDELPLASAAPMPAAPRRVAETEAEAIRAAQTVDPADSWPGVDMPSPPPPPIVGPPPDPEVVLAEAAAMLDAGDLLGARDRMLTAVTVHRMAGRLDAALDACLQLLAVAPGDPRVHLAIANLQFDHGWNALAQEKLDLLVRLTSLTGDTQAEADVHGLASERLRDVPVGAAPAG